jgi:hypothetical protein
VATVLAALKLLICGNQMNRFYVGNPLFSKIVAFCSTIFKIYLPVNEGFK